MATKNWRKRVDERLGGKTGVAPPPRRPSRRLSVKSPEPEVRPQPVVASQKDKPQATPSGAGKKAGNINHGRTIPMLDPSSFVPPSAEPPHVPESGVDVDEHRSLRVYVILGCFIFGLVIGFLYHVTKEDEPGQTDDPPPAVIASNTGDEPATGELEKEATAEREDVEAIEGMAVKGYDDTKALLEDVEGILPGQQPLHKGEATYLSVLPKKPYGGLTGSNAPAPGFAASGSGTTGGDTLEPEMFIDDTTVGPELDIDF